MAFLLTKSEVGLTPPFEYYPTSDGTIVQGEVLKLTSGKLVKCGPTEKPDYVAMGKTGKNSTVPVAKVLPHMIFEVPAMAALTSINPGDKVTIHTDGLQITATTGSGVATVIEVRGKEIGDKALVQF